MTALADTCVSNVSASKDGTQLTYLKQRRQLDVYVGELQGRDSRLESVHRLTLDDRSDIASSWTRDGRDIYIASNRQSTYDVFRQPVESGAAEAVLAGPGNQRGATLSPDGTFLLYLEKPAGSESAPWQVMRIPVGGGPAELVVQTTESAQLACPTSSSASCVLSESQERRPTFIAFDPFKGKGREIGKVDGSVGAWALSPDGSRIAFIGGVPEYNGGNLSVRSMSVTDGAVHDLNVGPVPLPQGLSWSPDGKSLFIIELVATGDSPGWRVLHADLAGHVDVLHYSRPIWQWLSSPLPSPDGRYLAFDLLEFQSNAWSLTGF